MKTRSAPGVDGNVLESEGVFPDPGLPPVPRNKVRSIPLKDPPPEGYRGKIQGVPSHSEATKPSVPLPTILHPAEQHAVAMEFPLGSLMSNQVRRHHIDCNLNEAESSLLSRLLSGLDAANARLENGKHVITRADAMRWLLQQLRINSKPVSP